MSHELMYTSAPRGLLDGSRGFCTVVRSAAMPHGLAERLESMSNYRELFADESRPNPVCYSHVLLSLGGRRIGVLSRLCYAGLDYTSRPNMFAHHLALDDYERPQGGPAFALSQPGLFETAWDGVPRELPRGRMPPPGNAAATPCRTWNQLAGDAGWAGVLAETVATRSRHTAYIVVNPDWDSLALAREAVALLPPELRWEATFQTYYCKLPATVECRWRFVLPAADELTSARRQPNSLVIDLVAGVGRPPDGPCADAARTGRQIESTSVGAAGVPGFGAGGGLRTPAGAGIYGMQRGVAAAGGYGLAADAAAADSTVSPPSPTVSPQESTWVRRQHEAQVAGMNRLAILAPVASLAVLLIGVVWYMASRSKPEQAQASPQAVSEPTAAAGDASAEPTADEEDIDKDKIGAAATADKDPKQDSTSSSKGGSADSADKGAALPPETTEPGRDASVPPSDGGAAHAMRPAPRSDGDPGPNDGIVSPNPGLPAANGNSSPRGNSSATPLVVPAGDGKSSEGESEGVLATVMPNSKTSERNDEHKLDHWEHDDHVVPLKALSDGISKHFFVDVEAAGVPCELLKSVPASTTVEARIYGNGITLSRQGFGTVWAGVRHGGGALLAIDPKQSEAKPSGDGGPPNPAPGPSEAFSLVLENGSLTIRPTTLNNRPYEIPWKELSKAVLVLELKNQEGDREFLSIQFYKPALHARWKSSEGSTESEGNVYRVPQATATSIEFPFELTGDIPGSSDSWAGAVRSSQESPINFRYLQPLKTGGSTLWPDEVSRSPGVYFRAAGDKSNTSPMKSIVACWWKHDTKQPTLAFTNLVPLDNGGGSQLIPVNSLTAMKEKVSRYDQREISRQKSEANKKLVTEWEQFSKEAIPVEFQLWHSVDGYRVLLLSSGGPDMPAIGPQATP